MRTELLRLTRRELFGELHVPFVARKIVAQRATPAVVAEAIKAVFVLCGNAIVRSPAAAHQVVAGDVLILSEGAWCAADPLLPTTAITMYIDTDFLSANIRWIPPSHPLKPLLDSALTQRFFAANVRFESDVVRAFTPTLQQIAHATSYPADAYLALAASASLFAHTARQATVAPGIVPSARLRPGGIVARAAAEVVRDLDRRWSVADLASTVSISGSQLTRLFRDELGISPAAFVREQRLNEMARLLSTRATDVARAARQAGWRDASSASRAFKQRYGLSPHAYSGRSTASPKECHDLYSSAL